MNWISSRLVIRLRQISSNPPTYVDGGAHERASWSACRDTKIGRGDLPQAALREQLRRKESAATGAESRRSGISLAAEIKCNAVSLSLKLSLWRINPPYLSYLP